MTTFREFIARASNTSTGWTVISRLERFDDKLQRLLRFAARHRAIQAREDFYKRVRAKFPDQNVRYGPFKGLRYGDQESLCSSLIPKLLGSYENELHPWFETVLHKEYQTIIDIGCAEGYYAAGLAKILPGAHVFAYDTHPAAQAACRQMAELNGIADRISIGAFCDAATLQALDLSKPTLIICDCEGYEAQLFTPETVSHLTQADLMIECHDHIGQPITRSLMETFADTHEATLVDTVADHRKALELTCPELSGEPFQVRQYMVEERRHAPQTFLLLESRRTADG